MTSIQSQIMDAAVAAITEALAVATESVKKEQVLQGHVDTGKSLRSYETVTQYSGSEARGMVIAENYLVHVNLGVPPDKVRYPIRIMIDWFKRKGLPTKEAIRAAWATRYVHQNRQPGIPTVGSLRFSKTGQRTGFIDDGLENVQDEIAEAFERHLVHGIEIVLEILPPVIEPVYYEI